MSLWGQSEPGLQALDPLWSLVSVRPLSVVHCHLPAQVQCGHRACPSEGGLLSSTAEQNSDHQTLC